jgi:hypothetical protein
MEAGPHEPRKSYAERENDPLYKLVHQAWESIPDPLDKFVVEAVMFMRMSYGELEEIMDDWSKGKLWKAKQRGLDHMEEQLRDLPEVVAYLRSNGEDDDRVH